MLAGSLDVIAEQRLLALQDALCWFDVGLETECLHIVARHSSRVGHDLKILLAAGQAPDQCYRYVQQAAGTGCDLAENVSRRGARDRDPADCLQGVDQLGPHDQARQERGQDVVRQSNPREVMMFVVGNEHCS